MLPLLVLKQSPPYLQFQRCLQFNLKATAVLDISLVNNSDLTLDFIRCGMIFWDMFRKKSIFYNFFFIYCRIFCAHLGSFCVVSSFTTFQPNFTSGLLQVILPRPRIGMLSLVTVCPVITAFHTCCQSHHVFDQVNLWLAWVGFETAIFWQCSPGTVETQRLYPLRHGPRSCKIWCVCIYIYIYIYVCMFSGIFLFFA